MSFFLQEPFLYCGFRYKTTVAHAKQTVPAPGDQVIDIIPETSRNNHAYIEQAPPLAQLPGYPESCCEFPVDISMFDQHYGMFCHFSKTVQTNDVLSLQGLLSCKGEVLFLIPCDHA